MKKGPKTRRNLEDIAKWKNTKKETFYIPQFTAFTEEFIQNAEQKLKITLNYCSIKKLIDKKNNKDNENDSNEKQKQDPKKHSNRNKTSQEAESQTTQIDTNQDIQSETQKTNETNYSALFANCLIL